MPSSTKLSSARLGELGGVGRSPGLPRELRGAVAQERGPRRLFLRLLLTMFLRKNSASRRRPLGYQRYS